MTHAEALVIVNMHREDLQKTYDRLFVPFCIRLFHRNNGPCKTTMEDNKSIGKALYEVVKLMDTSSESGHFEWELDSERQYCNFGSFPVPNDENALFTEDELFQWCIYIHDDDDDDGDDYDDDDGDDYDDDGDGGDGFGLC